MNGFYSVVDAVTERKTGDGRTDHIPVAVVFYDPLKRKTYVRPLVDTRTAGTLSFFSYKLRGMYYMEDIIEFCRNEFPSSGYRMRKFQNCRILARPGRTLDAICKARKD